MAASRSLALLVVAAFSVTSVVWSASKKKKKEEITQVLEIPKDPPQATVADAQRLVFHSSPLSNKGLLSQQVRDALKALFAQVRGAQIVKIRAFVAGSGDVRRVQAIISEVFTDKRLSIPAVTVVQVGALPLEGAQVILQSVSADKRDVNPRGLAFVSGQPGPAKESGERLVKALKTAGLPPDSMRRVTCFLNSLDHLKDVRNQVASDFPKASATYVQLRRDSSGEFVECEAIAALDKTPERSPSFVAPSGSHSQIALVGPVRLALTGSQMAFGREDKDVRLAFDRLGKALDGAGANWRSVAMLDIYALIRPLTETASKRRLELIDPANPPGSTMLIFEGLPSLDALLAMDAVAVVAR